MASGVIAEAVGLRELTRYVMVGRFFTPQKKESEIVPQGLRK